jgi:NADP-dependent 3-hydroxy acid dehydrogenase YdfG
MYDFIRGKVVVITGASSGIGAETARVLAGWGAKLVLGARRLPPLEQVAAQIRESGGEVVALETDVARKASVTALIDRACNSFGRIDVLVNNAADTRLAKLADGETDDWDRQIDTNIKGPLYGIAAALPRMLAQGDGHIVNIASILALNVIPSSAVYSATKFALRGIAEGLRIEAGPAVRSTIIYVGATETGIKTTVKYQRLRPVSIADSIAYAIAQPPSVGVNEITIRPVEQPN